MNGKPDDSYKFGAGRFIMKQGLLEECGQELRRYGRRPFFVGGPTAISVVRERASKGLAAAGLEGVFSVHPGHVYHEAARAKAEEARAAWERANLPPDLAALRAAQRLASTTQDITVIVGPQ